MAGGLVGRALDYVEERTGYTVTQADRLSDLEESVRDARLLERELRELAYTALDYVGGKPQDLKAEERRKLAQKARVVWMRDPQAGAAVDLQNDFVFGRGVQKAKAKDEQVQAALDEAWDDPTNQRILTSHEAQLALGTDLALQSNLFFLLFDEGDDGKVKLSLLNHDSVENVVEHPEDRFAVLYFVARSTQRRWDFEEDKPLVPKRGGVDDPNIDKKTGKAKILYYKHWQNVEQAEEEDSLPEGYAPAKEKIGDGKVMHLAENRTTEMHFGHPRMDRTLRWFNAYNRFMEARVDMMAAAAAFVMKRKVKGSESQLSRTATRALSRRSALGVTSDGEEMQAGPKPGAILNENEGVTYEDFKVTTNSGDAAQDARMLGAQVSAATRWPRSYYGDAESSNLATATSLELPVLKRVEAIQELFEGVFRWFIDRVIARAVEAGKIKKKLDPAELQEARERWIIRELQSKRLDRPQHGERPEDYVGRILTLMEAHEDKAVDEVSTERNLDYEFRMPNPLRRAMNDLTTAIQGTAQTFDPNGTNVELSRVLLTIALSEALEVQDAADVVERIFPPGYVDPALAQMQGPTAPGAPGDFGPFGPEPAADPNAPPGATGSVGADGQRHGEGNAYGAPQRSQAPEQIQQSFWWPKARDGSPLPASLVFGTHPDTAAPVSPEALREAVDRELGPIVSKALDGIGSNGNGNGGSA